MQQINKDVFHWSFMGVFFGTPLVCIALLVQAIWGDTRPGAVYGATGAVVYLIGSFLVTVVGNVPRNDALAAVDSDGTDAEDAWNRFAFVWTRWNHVRTVASMAAAGAFVAALVAG